jgi:hypothetical protein
MGEKMNRINGTWLTLGTVAALFALGTACSSGGEDDGDDKGTAGSGTGGSGVTTAGTTGAGTAGSTVIPAGGSTGTAGTGTAGTGTAGTGGTASTGPSVCDGKTFALPVGEAFIDDFETDTRFLGWYAFSDTTPPNKPDPERVASGALTTGFAGHMHATGIKSSKAMGYGAGFGFGLVDPAKGACVDLTAFDGISFWAKGTAGTDNTLKFQVVSPSTQPADSMPVGDCASSAAACAFKHPAKTVTLTADWKQFVIKFADLAPASAYSGKVLGFNMITDGPDYDVQIDEATFFSGTAPTGPVAPEAAGGAGAQ